MRISLNTSLLSKAVEISSRFIAKNATLPILQNILLHAEDKTLTIRATDMEKYISITIPLTEESGKASLTVDARTLGEILKTISQDTIDLSLNTETDTIVIQSGKDTFDLRGISANEYVSLPDFQSQFSVSLPTQDFAHAINKVEYTVTEKTFSPIFTGVLLWFQENGTLSCVGTDSFRLAEYNIPNLSFSQEHKVIIPKTAINDFQYIAQSITETQFSLASGNNMIQCIFETEEMTITASSILIQGSFPDYRNEKIMPTNFSFGCDIMTKELDMAIKKIAILTRDNKTYTQYDVTTDNIHISSGKTDKGNAQTDIAIQPVLHESDTFSFGLNGKYVWDALKHMSGDQVSLRIVDTTHPIVFLDPQDEAYTYIVRPLQQ